MARPTLLALLASGLLWLCACGDSAEPARPTLGPTVPELAEAPDTSGPGALGADAEEAEHETYMPPDNWCGTGRPGPSAPLRPPVRIPFEPPSEPPKAGEPEVPPDDEEVPPQNWCGTGLLRGVPASGEGRKSRPGVWRRTDVEHRKDGTYRVTVWGNDPLGTFETRREEKRIGPPKRLRILVGDDGDIVLLRNR